MDESLKDNREEELKARARHWLSAENRDVFAQLEGFKDSAEFKEKNKYWIEDVNRRHFDSRKQKRRR